MEETCAERIMKESSSQKDCFIASFFSLWYFLPCSFNDDDNPHRKKVYLELSSGGGYCSSLLQFVLPGSPESEPDTLQVGKLRSNFPVQDDDILRFTLPN